MKNKSKLIIGIVSLVILITTISIMIWLSTKSTESVDNYKHIGYQVWLNEQTASPQVYTEFKMDLSTGGILATSTQKGTYVIDASSNIINQLTQIDTNGIFTSSVMQSVGGATFGQIFKATKEISIGLWAALIIVSTVASLPLLYILKSWINKKIEA